MVHSPRRDKAHDTISFLSFEMEWPATVLAAIDFAILIDGIVRYIKRRLPSTFRAGNSVTLELLLVVNHHQFPIQYYY